MIFLPYMTLFRLECFISFRVECFDTFCDARVEQDGGEQQQRDGVPLQGLPSRNTRGDVPNHLSGKEKVEINAHKMKEKNILRENAKSSDH